MAFVNAIFPNPRLIHGLQVKTSLPTTVVANGTKEFRINKLRTHRKQWTYPSRAMLTTDRRTLEVFMQDIAQYSLNSFKYRDPDRHNWNMVQLRHLRDNYFRLTERGVDYHPIYHLDSNVTVRLNGTPTTFTQSIQDGVPVIAVPGAGAGSAVTITGGYFYAVRLDQAEFSFGMTALDTDNSPYADTIADITLVEVFEYDESLWT